MTWGSLALAAILVIPALGAAVLAGLVGIATLRLSGVYLARISVRYASGQGASMAIEDAVTLAEVLRAQGVSEITLFPLYPQYASSSTGSSLELAMKLLYESWNVPPVKVVGPFFAEPSFLDAFTEVARPVMAYIVRLVGATRTHPEVVLGVSPRGGVALQRAAQALKLVVPLAHQANPRETFAIVHDACYVLSSGLSVRARSRTFSSRSQCSCSRSRPSPVRWT